MITAAPVRSGQMVSRSFLAGLIALAGCTAGVGPGPGPPPAADLNATATEIVDGDTVRVRYANGSRDTVRLLGIDAPEISGGTNPAEFTGVPDTAAGRACLEEWALRAATAAGERLTARRVGLAFDPNIDSRDDYGRLLAYVLVGNETVNLALVAGGYARVYDTPFTRRSRYRAAQTRARRNGTGLWTCRSPG